MKLRGRRSDEGLVTQAFDISVILKGLDGVLEILGGLVLLIVPLSDIRALLIWITGKELSEDPNDFIATRIVRLAHMLSVSAYNFTIAYLLIHGFVKVQFTFSHSIPLLALTVLDVVVVALTVWEYTRLRRRPPLAPAQEGRRSA
ncbi:MAG TPA: DUF2127 domain-containing protein [Thermoleophilia bacterium]|nr:DUF2127 domain-containing protein [Thermoleophilia bacterium]